MNKETLIEQITWMIDQIEDCEVLKDIYNLVSTIFRHHKAGKWGR